MYAKMMSIGKRIPLAASIAFQAFSVKALSINEQALPSRFGDWEADLVIGARQKQALVKINECVSRYSIIFHVPFKQRKP
jgi:IS30 family transposase|uniref:hypothetical protein n=1 Tax=Polaromonas sp. E10S TaxID=1840239 RepID=UPI0015E80189|nr:hypothetical protein [Polaromonas sp. E10S]